MEYTSRDKQDEQQEQESVPPESEPELTDNETL